MLNIDKLQFTIYCCNVFLFIWGVIFFFKKPHAPGLGYRVIQVTSLVTWTYQSWSLWHGVLSKNSHAVLFCIQVYSMLVFLTAVSSAKKVGLSLAYSKDKPSNLANTGPYKFMRHPFYSSYSVLYLGVAICSADWISTLLAVTMTGIYIHAIQLEEKKIGESEFAESYENFKKGTRFKLFPGLY